MVLRMIALDRGAFEMYLQSDKRTYYSRIILILIGVAFGLIAILLNRSVITSFDSLLIGMAIVPTLLVCLGILMVIVTKFGLTLILWAGARGFGGPGKMREVNRSMPVVLIPGVLGVPLLIEYANSFLIVAFLVGMVWMYLMCVRVMEVTQQFQRTRAYLSVAMSFLFFVSIYYLVV